VRSDVLLVARRDRRPRIECSGGIAARETEPDTVYLVSTAATPLGGDAVSVHVVVEPGAVLRVRAAAAMVTLPGAASLESHSIWTLDVEGELDIDPEPTVVAAAARHLTSTRLNLTADSRVRLRERVQIGRTNEQQGFWSGSLYADVDGSALLRHRIELGNGSVTADELNRPAACISELHYPESDADTAGMPLALARGGCLSTWQGERL
jgi:urease accessory protein